MRIATYLGLVVRRVWAKKGILFGSFLGATLVIALLVVVPLYEASVQAVDLEFSIDNALEEETQVTAFSTQNAYLAPVAQERREIVTDARQQWLQPWYPSQEERTQSREFTVIPSGPDTSVDWIEEGEAWKEETEDFLAGGGDPEEAPPPPYPRPPREALVIRIFTAPGLEGNLDVLAGEYATSPNTSTTEYGPIPVMIGQRVAELTGADVGDTFFIKPFTGLAEVFEYVEVAGIVTATDPTAAIWGIDDPDAMIFWDQAVFDQWLRPVSWSPEIDPWARATRGLPSITVTQRWRMPLDNDSVQLQDVDTLQDRLAQFRAQVARESAGAIPTATFITTLLAAFTTRSVVIGGPILAMLALVVGGAIYFLVYTSALTVEREGSEIALLKSRGASSAQTVGIHLGQSLVIATIAALVAPFVARFFVGLTGRIPPLSTLTGGDPLEVNQVRSVVPFMAAGGVIVFLSMGVAIVPYARRGILALRSLAARPGTKSVWQRYNIDLFAIALSLVLLIQLRLRGFINTSTEEATLDPLAVIFPALLLFTGALILLRLFPYLLRFVGWAFTKVRSLAAALTGWHLGRNPIPYGRLALLVWVTTGLGAFALTYAATLEESYQDRAAFAAGADARVVGERAGYAQVPEGSTGTPVLRTAGSPRAASRQAETLAVRPDEFSGIVTWRSDFGAATPQEAFGPLRPGGEAPDVGVELPEDATELRLEGVVVPPTVAEVEAGEATTAPPHRLLIRVIDAGTRVWTMVADVDYTSEAWTTATVDLTTGKNTEYFQPPEPPLTMTAMWVERSDTTEGTVVDGDELLFLTPEVVGPDGTSPLDLAEMTATGDLQVLPNTPASYAAEERYSSLPPGQLPPTTGELEADPLWRDGTATRWNLPEQRTRASVRVPQLYRIPEPLRVLLDGEAAAIAGLDIGSQSSYTIGGEVFEGEMVGFVEEVPTLTDPRRQGAMIIDLDAYNATINGAATWSLSGAVPRATSPDELWIATDDPDAAVRTVAGQMPDEPDTVITLGGAEASFSSRPVQIGLVAILFVGAATGVILALAGVTGYVLLAVSRRAREMGVLRALGFERTSVGVTFALEQTVVIGLGAAIGVIGGILLVVIMLPFFQLGETATEIEPPVLLVVPGWQLAIYIAIVGVLLIASVLWATRKVSVRKMSEVLREVER